MSKSIKCTYKWYSSVLPKHITTIHCQKVNNLPSDIYAETINFLNIICPQKKIHINCFPSFKCARKKSKKDRLKHIKDDIANFPVYLFFFYPKYLLLHNPPSIVQKKMFFFSVLFLDVKQTNINTTTIFYPRCSSTLNIPLINHSRCTLSIHKIQISFFTLTNT